MTKKPIIEQDGTIVDKVSDVKFRVQLDNSKRVVMAHASGNMKMKYIKMYQGDRVKVEMNPFTLDIARIVYRYKK